MKALRWTAALAAVTTALGARVSCAADAPPVARNIILIVADDLGFGDLGCYGQKKIKTPHLDAMAAEGMRFTDFYAGSTVCAPSRCVLMTGQHTGHCWVRGNGVATAQTLRPDDVTVAETLQAHGMKTGMFGKWGLGELGSTGHPNRQGFDAFFGYLNQRHAHNYYPTFLIRDGEKVALRNEVANEDESGGGWATVRVDYSHDLIFDEALQWLDSAKDGRFFLYLPLTIPHANNEGTRGTGDGQDVPDYGIYADEDWPDPDKGQAAMITRMDRDIGRLFARLKAHRLDDDTLVLFTSDNGHHREGGNNPDFFDANGPLRGMKRDLYEGGVRVPLIARWPGVVAANSVTDHVSSFSDIFATLCECAHVNPAAGQAEDSISFVPVLAGRPGGQRQHDSLYWEFYEQGGKQAVRFGKWKAVKMPIFSGTTELYDLSVDLGESRDVAADFPDVVAQAEIFLADAHRPNANWKPRGKPGKGPPPGDGRPRIMPTG